MSTWQDSRNGPLPLLLLALTVVTGMVDAVSFLAFGRVFVANMTGNVVFLGFALGGVTDFSIAASLVAIATFLVGALAGGRAGSRFSGHRGRLLAVGVTIEIALVGVAVVVALVSTNVTSAEVRYALLAGCFADSTRSVRRRSISSPPRCVSPLVASTWKTPSSTRRIEMSNVPPPRS